ncbi:MAG: hypothetical protein U0793_03085 [Gemmataceae bacterium]
MIICRTPYRISFFGGGTDYPAWYRAHGGAVLAAAIDKYCYLTVRELPPFFEHKIRVVYRKIETCQSVKDIEHPAVRETMRHLGFDDGLEIHHDGDLPARSGMGSSSAFTVGLLHALYALRGETPAPLQLAEESIHIEQQRLGETVGSQDQVMAAFGGLRSVQFHRSGEAGCSGPRHAMTVDRVPLTPDRSAELQAHLMLFYTGIPRTASDVAHSYVANLDACRPQLETLRRLVDEATDLLVSRLDIRGFGELLHEAWQTKRSLSPLVSNARIDALYRRALAGAVGGKLAGAGGGGFLLLFVPPAKQKRVLAAMADVLHVPFAFDTEGSRILFEENPSPSRSRTARRSPRGAWPFDVGTTVNAHSRIYVAGAATPWAGRCANVSPPRALTSWTRPANRA